MIVLAQADFTQKQEARQLALGADCVLRDPLRPDVLSAIERITNELYPGVPVIPTMSTGATDSLYMRKAGIPMYGTSGIFGDMDDSRAHGKDERIAVQSFFDGQEYLYRLVKALAGE